MLVLLFLILMKKIDFNGLQYSIEGSDATLIRGLCSSGTLMIPNNLTFGDRIYRVIAVNDSAFYACLNPNRLVFELPSNIISIGESSFFLTANIENEVIIPSSVQTIKADAFRSSRSIPSFKFQKPSNLISIGNNAFSYCSNLGYIELPDSVREFGAGVFMHSSITSIKLPKVPKNIELMTFKSCRLLTIIDGISDIEKIGDSSFEGCNSLMNINLERCTKIGPSAFKKCSSLETITFGFGLKVISKSCFEECKSLQKIKFSSTVTSIEQQAFKSSRIKILILNPNIVHISSSSFEDASINEVHFDGNKPPKCNRINLSIENLSSIFVQKGYQDKFYCGIPVNYSIYPTDQFTPSNSFTPSDSKYVEIQRLRKQDGLPTRSGLYGMFTGTQVASVSVSVFVTIILIGAILMVYYVHVRKKGYVEQEFSDYLFVSSSSSYTETESTIYISYSWEYLDSFDDIDLEKILSLSESS